MGKIIYKNKIYYTVRELMGVLEKEELVKIIGLVPYTKKEGEVTIGEIKDKWRKVLNKGDLDD